MTSNDDKPLLAAPLPLGLVLPFDWPSKSVPWSLLPEGTNSHPSARDSNPMYLSTMGRQAHESHATLSSVLKVFKVPTICVELGLLQRIDEKKNTGRCCPKTHADRGHMLPNLACLTVMALKVLSTADGIGGMRKGSGLSTEAETENSSVLGRREALWERELLR